MSLRDYLSVGRKRWRLVTVCVLMVLGAAAVATFTSTPIYQAEAQLFISASNQGNDLAGAAQGGLFTQQRVKSYADIVATPPVTQPVIDKLKLNMTSEQLAEQITAINPLDTVLLQVRVRDPDARRASQIANAIATQFTVILADLETPVGAKSPLIKATVVKSATTPVAPVTPRIGLNLILGLLAGLAIGIAVAVMREILDTTLKTTADVKFYGGAPLLASVPEDGAAGDEPLAQDSSQQVKGGQAKGMGRAEAYRQVRTNLQFLNVDRPAQTVVVTSSIADEGKTTTACNLALALAEGGAEVVLVEGDLRRPRVATYMGLEGAAGLTNVLLGQASVDDVLQPWSVLSLSVLASGPLPPNPSELLGSANMADLLKQLTDRADIVIIDAPPILPVTDAAVVAVRCDGAIMVVRHGHTRRDHLLAAADAIEQVGARLLGTVFNRVPRTQDAYAYTYQTLDKPARKHGGARGGRPSPSSEDIATRAASRAATGQAGTTKRSRRR